MFKKILISLIVCFSLTQSVYAEDVEIPTDGVKIDVERKALESDNATGAVDIKIYNNTNQEIGILISSQQSIGWLIDKEVEEDYRVGSISSDYHTVTLYVKPHRFVTKNGFNTIMMEEKEQLKTPVAINYSVYTDLDTLKKVDINNQESVNNALTKGLDNGVFNLNKDDTDSFKNNLPVTETIEDDIKAVLSPKEKKTVTVNKGNIFVPISVVSVIVITGIAFVVLKKKGIIKL